MWENGDIGGQWGGWGQGQVMPGFVSKMQDSEVCSLREGKPLQFLKDGDDEGNMNGRKNFISKRLCSRCWDIPVWTRAVNQTLVTAEPRYYLSWISIIFTPCRAHCVFRYFKCEFHVFFVGDKTFTSNLTHSFNVHGKHFRNRVCTCFQLI